ncbi:GAF domain-containing protein [Conexibacter sp. W3-3-2]|nr:GAF domain-containing protein [Conexibacter sp. W3-3-2]
MRAMGMRATTVRFSDDVWNLVEHEATAQGISAAQFIRDAALLRAAVLIGRRGHGDEMAELEEVARGALRANGRPVPDPAVPDPVLAEPRRLAALAHTGLMDGQKDATLDRLARTAGKLLDAPMALVSLVDHERQVFACSIGLPSPWAELGQTPSDQSFCRHVVARRAPLVVEDARRHPDLRDNPSIHDLGVIAYLGIPLTTSEGIVLGSLCVIDHVPRVWSRSDVLAITDLAEAAALHLDRRIIEATAAV